MKVKEVAELTGVSVRTLHHYDEIGLLTPDHLTEAGYRVYSEANIAALQQILFFREFGFPLKKIKELITSRDFNRQEAFELQHKMLLAKRRQLDTMISTIEKTIQFEKGERMMTNEEKFQGFNFGENQYEQEARERWGDQAVEESAARIAGSESEFTEEMNRIYSKLSKLRNGSPASTEAQEAIGEWFNLLNKIGDYSLEAFKNLGEMYTADERFTKNIDQFGDGLAVFMRNAMNVYSKR